MTTEEHVVLAVGLVAALASGVVLGAHMGAARAMQDQCYVSSIRSDELPAHPEPDLTPFERQMLGK